MIPTRHAKALTRPKGDKRRFVASDARMFCLTSQMSHAGSWRAACGITTHILRLHFETPSIARGVTDPSVGSGALFGDCALYGFVLTCSMRHRRTQLQSRRVASELQPDAESRCRGTDGVHDLRNTP